MTDGHRLSLRCLVYKGRPGTVRPGAGEELVVEATFVVYRAAMLDDFFKAVDIKFCPMASIGTESGRFLWTRGELRDVAKNGGSYHRRPRRIDIGWG